MYTLLISINESPHGGCNIADHTLIAKLREGVEAWNSWRKDNERFYMDFGNAKLRGTDLRGIDLSCVDLGMADLNGVDLRDADLSGSKLFATDLRWANLRETDLTRADLEAADLRWANLSTAKLTGANLSRARLKETNLIGANLSETDFSQAILDKTIFGLTDLSTTNGLDNCAPHNQCIVDYETLQLSKNLPESFLRSCGLPDHYIEYLPALTNQPIQYYSCFISYSNKDEEFTQRLYSDLQGKGVRCYYAPEDMKIGEKFRVRIDEVIRLHEKLLLVLSKESIDSGWVEKEVESAFEKEEKINESVLFPIRLDDAVMDCEIGWAADIKRSRHIGDFRAWKKHDKYKVAITRLLRALKTGDE